MEQCSVKVVGPEKWDYLYPTQCKRKGVVERDGKWYCRQHDPEEVSRREFALNAKYEEHLRKMRLGDAAPDLLAALKQVEWTNAVDGGIVCPWCGARIYDGHETWCPRQMAIAKAERD